MMFCLLFNQIIRVFRCEKQTGLLQRFAWHHINELYPDNFYKVVLDIFAQSSHDTYNLKNVHLLNILRVNPGPLSSSLFMGWFIFNLLLSESFFIKGELKDKTCKYTK